jgi:hypothetical protein
MSKTSATDAAHLTELVNIISDAVKVVLSEYSAAGESVPSLDSTAPGPFDSPEKVPVGLAKAVKIIEGACAQLSFTVASPGHIVTNVSVSFQHLLSTEISLIRNPMGYVRRLSPTARLTGLVPQFEEPACLLVVSDNKIADLLLNKPEGVHVDVLAKESGLDPGKLGRILRLLVTRHCFKEGAVFLLLQLTFSNLCVTVKPDVFANNRLSMKLLSTDPVSGLVGHM